MKHKQHLIIRASGNAKVFFGRDEDEHCECVRLREKVRFLESMLSDKEDTIKKQSELINHLLGGN